MTSRINPMPSRETCDSHSLPCGGVGFSLSHGGGGGQMISKTRIDAAQPRVAVAHLGMASHRMMVTLQQGSFSKPSMSICRKRRG